MSDKSVSVEVIVEYLNRLVSDQNPIVYDTAEFFPILAAARDYIIAANAALGPKCPKCGHWLKAEHRRRWFGRATGAYDYYLREDDSGVCEMGVAELIRQYPTIAAELGVTP